MKHTKESIAQYCVDSKGDKDLAEQIARQFERAGFPLGDYGVGVNCPYIGVCNWADGYVGTVVSYVSNKNCLAQTTLSELTKMVDEMLGDEYAIVREFVEWFGRCNGWASVSKENTINAFINHRTKHFVTLHELKSVYAEAKGVDVSKIEVREEGK